MINGRKQEVVINGNKWLNVVNSGIKCQKFVMLFCEVVNVDKCDQSGKKRYKMCFSVKNVN